MIRSILWRTIGASALGTALLLPAVTHAAQLPAKHSHVSHKAPVGHKWTKYNSHTHIVHLLAISAYGKDTYNIDGGARGALKITVPVGSKVVVTYKNLSLHVPHGLEVVRYTGSLPTAYPPPAPAFPGAASPNYIHGTPRGVVQHFHFFASKAGKYLLICPVRNHVKFGHWAWFIVSGKAKTATAVLR